MAETDFHIDYDSEVPHFDESLQRETEDRLLDLAKGNQDMVGAAVAVSQPAFRDEDPFIFQARVVVYMSPENIAASKQSDTLEGALKAALSAVERQVREQRKKLREPWKRPDISGTPDDLIGG